MAKEFCSCTYISFPCPCRLQHNFLNLISAKQSCPIVLASHNWLQLGFLLHMCLLLSHSMPRREIIYLRCTLAYRSSTPQNNLWSPFIRLDTWVRAQQKPPSSIQDPIPLAVFSFVWLLLGASVPFVSLIDFHCMQFCKPEFSLEQKKGGSLSLLWWKLWENLSECAEHRPWKSRTWCCCCCWYLFSPFLSFRVATTWSAVLHRSRWTCDESHGYGFPRPAQFPTRKPGLPTPTFLLQHTTSSIRAGGEILHMRTLWLSDLTVWEEGAIAKWARWRASALLNTC